MCSLYVYRMYIQTKEWKDVTSPVCILQLKKTGRFLPSLPNVLLKKKTVKCCCCWASCALAIFSLYTKHHRILYRSIWKKKMLQPAAAKGKSISSWRAPKRSCVKTSWPDKKKCLKKKKKNIFIWFGLTVCEKCSQRNCCYKSLIYTYILSRHFKASLVFCM